MLRAANGQFCCKVLELQIANRLRRLLTFLGVVNKNFKNLQRTFLNTPAKPN